MSIKKSKIMRKIRKCENEKKKLKRGKLGPKT